MLGRKIELSTPNFYWPVKFNNRASIACVCVCVCERVPVKDALFED